MAFTINRKITLVLICLMTFACSFERKTNPKSNGTASNHDSIFVSYFNNNTLKEKGIIEDSLRKGLWKEWYSDGRLKWKGYFDENNIRQINISQQTPDIIFDNGKTDLEVGKEYLVRVFVEGLHPEDMVITTKDKASMFFDKENDYFKFKFRKNGTIVLKVYAAIPSEEYFVGDIVLRVN